MDSRVQVRLAFLCVGVCGFCEHSVSKLCMCVCVCAVPACVRVCVFSQWVNNKS